MSKAPPRDAQAAAPQAPPLHATTHLLKPQGPLPPAAATSLATEERTAPATPASPRDGPSVDGLFQRPSSAGAGSTASSHESHDSCGAPGAPGDQMVVAVGAGQVALPELNEPWDEAARLQVGWGC